MMRGLINRYRTLTLIMVLVSTVGVFTLAPYKNSAFAKDKKEEDPSLYDELKIFTDVLAIVQRDYVKPIDNKQVVEGAIKGMLATLDPHSGYLDPDFYQDLQVQTKGEFGGLGIEITIKDGMLVVVAPMEGSPAEKVGIKPGDAIVKIDGKFTKEFSLVDAVKKLRGPKGSAIDISVQRKGVANLLDYTVERENIEVRSVKGRYLGEGYGYARISQFMEKTGDDLAKTIRKLHEGAGSEGLKGLVLDLRNNPGGLLTQAISVSDLFLTDGIIVYTDGRIESQKQKFFAHARGTEPDYPIIVIVNGGSASASEIVAGALKDHGRALILGTQTFGKGSVQTITPLENGGALTLTTALYYTKSGRSLQGLGVAPDVIVEQNEPAAPQESNGPKVPLVIHEGDLPGAITNPTEKVPSKNGHGAMQRLNNTPVEGEESDLINPEIVNLDEWAKRDRQFQRAFELLKTFNIFKSASSATDPKKAA